MARDDAPDTPPGGVLSEHTLHTDLEDRACFMCAHCAHLGTPYGDVADGTSDRVLTLVDDWLCPWDVGWRQDE